MKTAFSICPVKQNDLPDLALLHSAAWQDTYHDLLPAAALAKRGPDQMLKMWETIYARLENEKEDAQEKDKAPEAAVFVAQNEVGLLGFVGICPQRDAQLRARHTGEISALYVAKSARRQGFGRVLMEHAAQNLQNAGHESAALYVLKGNRPACAFYQQMGGSFITDRTEVTPEATYKKQAYGWPDLGAIIQKSQVSASLMQDGLLYRRGFHPS